MTVQNDQKQGGGALDTQLNLNNLDKSDWKTYRFDEIARSISERIDPTNTDLEVYVGLEHIDSESIHLKRHGKREDVKGQKLRFYPGDVIFGRRRAYQRKAAVATMDGFCSAHALVLRANPDVIDPELFPFFLHSDQFMDRAVDISVGSLSPTINWGALKHQEFVMPPKEQQKNISSLFWQSDSVIESEINVKNKLTLKLDSEIEFQIHGENLSGKTINQVIEGLSQRLPVTSVKKVGEVFKGRGIPKSAVLSDGIPSVRYGELYTKHHRIIRKHYSYISQESAIKATRLQKHDILFAGSGETIIEIGKSSAFISDTEAYAGGDILIFRPEDMDGIYLGYLMNSQLVRQQLNKFGTGATVMHVYASDIEKIRIPEIERKEQIKIGRALESISKNIRLFEKQILRSKTLQKELINKVF